MLSLSKEAHGYAGISHRKLDLKDISKSGYFQHFLGTFGIENGFNITLPNFDDLKFAKTVCHIRKPTKKLQIIWSHRVIFHILKIC